MRPRGGTERAALVRLAETEGEDEALRLRALEERLRAVEARQALVEALLEDTKAFQHVLLLALLVFGLATVIVLAVSLGS